MHLQVHYVVDKAKWGGLLWKGSTGYLTEDILSKHLPAASDSSLVMVCGPPGLMACVSGGKVSPTNQGEVTGILKKLGFNESSVFKF